MKNFLYFLLLILSIALAGICIYTNVGKTNMLITYMFGFIGGMALVMIKLNSNNQKINSYKRELEKESVLSSENSSKVKVLESKIEVLEKALENALNKNG